MLLARFFFECACARLLSLDAPLLGCNHFAILVIFFVSLTAQFLYRKISVSFGVAAGKKTVVTVVTETRPTYFGSNPCVSQTLMAVLAKVRLHLSPAV